MKRFFLGFVTQLIINILLQLIHIIGSSLIIKYAPEPQYPMSVGKDFIWQVIFYLCILVYSAISLIVSFIILRKKDIKYFAGFGIIPVLWIIGALGMIFVLFIS